ncbi:hypothetical protein BDY24DRAFT_156174 [Mrakia frigida]|uniref:uncharacterized protein n=1 Tax=Mrakia frigida TaxID=29902 RepID=UPI003FCC2109
MILTEPSSDDKQRSSPPSASSSTERTPLLLPSTSSTSAPIDPPPSYSPPTPKRSIRKHLWLKVFLFLVVVGLVVVGTLTYDEGEVEDKEEGGGGGRGGERSKTPMPPPVGGNPAEKEKVDKGFKGRRWDSTLYLPHLSETHGTSPSSGPYVCNRVLPSSSPPSSHSSHSYFSSSNQTLLRTAYVLPLEEDLLLFIHFGAVQRRPGFQGAGETNVSPKGTVTFLPWREEDEALKGEEWLEDRVLVLVEREEEMEVEKGGGGTEVCFMEGRGAEGVGVFSSSPSPPILNVTIYVPTSPNSDRTMGRFSVTGLEGSLAMGDMEPNAFDLEKSLQEKSWLSLEVKAKRAAIYIKSLAAHALSLSTENSSVSLDNVRITSNLEIKTTGQGTYFGNLSIVAGAKAAVHTESGNSRSIISLITPVPYSPSTPHFELPINAASDPNDDEDEEDASKINFPSLPGKTPHSPLPSLAPIKMQFTSTHGNITASFQRHFYHVPLQATIASDTGSVGVNLSPHFQGSLRLSSPVEIKRLLPEEPPFPTSDPYDLGRKFRVVLTDVKFLVTGYMGWGFAGKPDLPGSLIVHTNQGVIGVARFGGRLPFDFE